MDIRVIFLLITSGANLALAIAIIFKNWRNRINVFFSMTLFSIASWSFFLAMYFTAPDLETVRRTIPPIYLSAAAIAFFFSYFSTHFPFRSTQNNPVQYLMDILFVFLVVYSVLGIGIEQIVAFDQVTRNHANRMIPLGYGLFSAFFGYYISRSFYFLFKKMRASNAIHKTQIRVVAFSTLFAAVFGTLFDLIIPVVTFEYTWVGPFFTVIMVFVVSRFVFFQNK